MQKFIYTALAAGLMLSSCAFPNSAPVQPNTTQNNPLVAQAKSQGIENITVMDVSQNPNLTASQRQGKGSLLLTLNFGDNQGFTTQANKNGGVQKTSADLSDLEIFLFDVDSGTIPPSSDPAVDLNTASGVTTVHSGVISFTGTGSQAVLLTNIPANAVTGTGKYYVGVRGLETGANISSFSGYEHTTGAGGPVFVSDTGGDGGTTGKVSVDASYAVSDTTALGVNLELLDEIGASIDSTVNVSDGAVFSPGITIQ